MILAALLLAQAAAPACPAIAQPLPAELAGWRRTGAGLSTGRAVVRVTLDPRLVLLRNVPPPGRPGRMVVESFRIARAGTYGIALDQKGWIDLYRAGSRTALASTQHGHGPACSGIRKIVRFDLAPGDYNLVVGELGGAKARLMLVR